LSPALGVLGSVAWAATAGVIVLMVYLVRRPERADVLVTESVVGWRGRVTEFMRRFVHTIGGISTGPRFVMALLLSVAAWAMQVWTYALTARSAHFNLSLVGTVAALLAVNLGFALRATPGNVGVFQAAYALTAAAFGMDKDQAIAVAFLIQTQQILPITVIGAFLAPEFIFKRKKVVRAADEGLDLRSRADQMAP